MEDEFGEVPDFLTKPEVLEKMDLSQIQVPNIDLRPDYWIWVKEILENTLSGHEVCAFGSRTKWTNREGSDLDLVVMDEVGFEEICKAKTAFENSLLPMKVDVGQWHKMTENFQKLIEKDLVKLTEKTDAPPAEWRKVELTQLIKIMGGGTPKTNNEKYWNGNIPWFSIADIPQDDTPYIYKTTKKITELGLKNCSSQLFPTETIIISARGTVGKLGITAIPMAMNQSCYALKATSGLNQKYLYYFLKNTVKDLQNKGHGAVFNTITRDTFNLLHIHLPPLPEQEAIAGVLSALDDKIAHNKKQNEILEETARALFQDWFVDFGPVKEKIAARQENRPEKPYLEPEIWNLFPNDLNEDEIPEGWEISTIGNEVELKGGGTPATKNPEYWGNNYFWATPKDLSKIFSPWIDSTERKISLNGLKQISSGLLPKNTVLLSSRAPVGYLAIASVPLAINQGFIAAICNKKLSFLYVFYWMKMNIDVFKQYANGATFQEISKKVFSPLKITKPPHNLTKLFEKEATQLFEKILKNNQENKHLEDMRDYLLPRLISGKIRVKF